MLTFNLPKIKRYLRLPITFEDDDELLHELFKFTTPDITKFIGFDLSATEYTDEVIIQPCFKRDLMTKAFPVLDPSDPADDIIIITINDGDAIDLDNFNYDTVKGEIVFNSLYDLDYGYRENQYKITYRAGFTDFPVDVEKAIYKLIKIEYYEGGNDLQSDSDLSSSKTKRDLIGNMPVDVYRILNSYRRNIV